MTSNRRRRLRGKRKGPVSRQRDESGVALLIVIWTLALLSSLAVGLTGDTRSDARLVRNLAEAAQARALAEAGMNLALFELLTTDRTRAWHNGTIDRDFTYDGGQVHLRLEDEGGKVDLVSAPSELVSGLLDRLGIEGETRDALMATLAKRRAAAARLKGSADVAGSDPLMVPDAPFDALEALVPDKAYGLADRLSPYATVYTHSPRVDPRTASQPVLLAVPGMDSGTITTFLADRARGIEPTSPSAAANYLGPPGLPVVRLHAEAVTATGARAVIEAVAALSGDPMTPFHLLLWRKGFAGEDAASP